MIVVNWPSNVNTRFFSYSEKPKNNTEIIEFSSGRVVAYEKNTKALKQVSCKLMLDVKSELPTFWAWFNDVLGQSANVFSCEALGESYYRFISVPEPDDTDTVTRTLNLELEEI